MSLSERLRAAMFAAEMSQVDLARAVGVKPPSVHGWLSGKSKFLRGENLLRAAAALNVNEEWLATGSGPKQREVGRSGRSNAHVSHFDVFAGDEYTDGASAIPLTEVRGSCGGGSINHSGEERPALIKEAAWFKKYDLRPENALAIWADGDSMADFIVDGDIVIFNKVRTEPRSGKIFLISHPDGLRIKRLRRDINGSWLLESNNPDKRSFPTETITIDQLDLLKIEGEFVYRQGG